MEEANVFIPVSQVDAYLLIDLIMSWCSAFRYERV